MLVTSVAQLGTGQNSISGDGEMATVAIDVPSRGRHLVNVWWDATNAKWISADYPIWTMASQNPLSVPPGASTSAWGYIFSTGNSSFPQTGTLPSLSYHFKEALAAGLKLQERVDGFLWSNSAIDIPKVAIQWYQFDAGESISQLITPSDGNAGVALTGTQNRGYLTTGWTNSPIISITKRCVYPDLYAKMVSGTAAGSLEALAVRYRWTS